MSSMNSSYTRIESDTPSDANAGGNQSNLSSNVTAMQQNPNDMTWVDRIKQSSHPMALVFFISFRSLPIIFYIFGNFLLAAFIKENRFVLHFIFIVLLTCVDFWNLKNIAGRLLVGLRWWNEIEIINAQSGEFQNIWVFETADPSRYINPIDSRLFWTLLYVQPVCWVLLAILAVFNFELLYLLLTCIAIFLSFTNAFAFTRCDKFGKVNSITSDIVSRTTSSLLSRFNPFARS